MWLVGVAVLLGLSGLAVTEQKTPPQRGPRQNETHRFRYESAAQPGLFFYCMFCPKRALDDSTYKDMQVPSCLKNYQYDVVWKEVLTSYEWENKKYPFCNTGETPGCGDPPVIPNIDWKCELGYSGELHSVYFPCQGQCNITGEVQYHLYCNASFNWELTAVTEDSKCEIVKEVTKIDDHDSQALVVPSVCAAVAVLFAIIITVILCVYRKRKKARKRQEQDGNVIPPREFLPQDNDRRQGHAGNGQIHNNDSGQQQGAVPVPIDPDSGLSSVDRDQAVSGVPVMNKNALSLKNNLKQKQNGSRSCKSRPKNTNVALQTINETTNVGNSVSVGSQVSDSESQETIPKQIIVHDIHEQSHSMPSGSPGQQGLQTLSLGSPRAMSNDLVNNSQTPLGYKRSQDLASINTSGESSQNRSHASTNKSQSSNAGNLLSNPDISINTDISASANCDSDSDLEPEETTKLLPTENHANETESEKSRLLEGYCEGGPRSDNNVGTDSSDRPPSTGASSGSGRSVRPETDGQPSSLGSSLSGSSREPVEHDDELVPEHDCCHADIDEEKVAIKEKEKFKVQVITKDELKEDVNKFYVYNDEPFTIAVKTRPNDNVEFKITKEGSGTPFLGRSNSNELSYLPNVIRVDRATVDDEGVFSWSILSSNQASTGTIEIVVLDKEADKRPADPPGASRTENVIETCGRATTGAQNLLPPTRFPSNTPRLDPNSFAEDPPLSGPKTPVPIFDNASVAGPLVKGEIGSGEFVEAPFNDLDPATLSDRFRTREGPSGTSVPSHPVVRSGAEVQEEWASVHETARKTVVDVSGTHNCCVKVSQASKALMAVMRKLKVGTFYLLAQQYGIDATWLNTLMFLEDPDCEESESVESLLQLLSDRGLRLGHLLDYFYSQNSPDLHLVKEILKIDHPECPYCASFYS